MSNTTRLLVLGGVRQFQPVHGYFLRRELLSWNVDQWANVQPGSIYHALQRLQKDGYVRELAIETEGNRPERTVYGLTEEGEVEYINLLREALWNVATFDPKPTMTLASFMTVLSREEVVAAMRHRVTDIDAKVRSIGYSVEDVEQSKTTPPYVREIYDLTAARLRAEQQWARELIARLESGAYTFAGEGDQPVVAQA